MPHHAGKNGLLLALCGFALLACGDAVIKSVAGQWPGTAVAALRYSIGAAGLTAMLWFREGRAGFTLPMPKLQLLRGASVAVATLCFFSSIFLMPLAEATAIQFTSPMMTAVISAVFLHERGDRRSWAAVLVAFVGVLIILRPNLAVLGPAALLPLGAALGMAFVMIGNRLVAGAGSALQMQFLIAVIAAPFLVGTAIVGHLSGMAALHVEMPDWTIMMRCILVAVSATTAHWLVYLGTTRSSAAQVAPMVYVQLLVALGLGALIYADFPDWISISGSAIIIVAGLYLWQIQLSADKAKSGEW